LKASRPKLTARIADLQTGVDVDDIDMQLDGVKLPNVYYDEAKGWAYALPDSTLATGTHTFAVHAKDRAGNIADGKSVTFSVVDFVQPKNPEHFIFSVTSDSHATGFGPFIMDKINKDPSELVLQNGDLVDNDTSAQWDIGRAQIASLTKPYMISPGNHEAFNNSLTNFMTYFGDPVYSFEFGNTLFVSLNSALSQSITGSDPTQFHYLQSVLNVNSKKNVVVYTHNPTRDTFGTAHEMLSTDADMLEKILGDYKAAHPEVSVNTIFGHLHTSQSWVKDGVTYTISGDEALKKYVTPQDGGFLSYTQFRVDEANVTHRFFPLTSRISVVDDAIQNGGKLILVKGAKRNMNVYGDFTTLTADYIVNFSKLNGVDKNFSSTADRIVSVSEDGLLTANNTGEAQITITSSGQTSQLSVSVVDQRMVTPVRISISPSSETLHGGETLHFAVTGYDVFGNTFALDSENANWSVSNGIGTMNNGSLIAAELKEDTIGDVTAEYNGMAASAKVYITKTVKPIEDKTPPAVPSGLKAVPGNKSATLSWDPNTEDDLAGYWIYDGSDTPIKVNKNENSIFIPGLEGGREYTFRIAAVDNSGNMSGQSDPVKVIPLSDNPAEEDIRAPAWINGNVIASNVTQTSVQLNWTEAMDDTAVEAYGIYSGGTLLTTINAATNSYYVTGLNPGTIYTFHIEAGDKANNWSSNGPSVKVTTGSSSGIGHHTSSGSNPGQDAQTGSNPVQVASESPISTDNGVEMKVDERDLKKETLADGKTITKLVVKADALNQALQMIGENGNGKTIKINLSHVEGPVKVELPLGVLKDAAEHANGAMIWIQAENKTYLLPLSIIRIDMLATALGTSAGNVTISVSIETVTDSERQRLNTTAANAGLTLLTDAVSFTITAEANGKTTEVNDFGTTYVTRTLTIDQSVDGSEATAVVYDPDTGEINFVPGIFEKVSGKTVVTIKRNSNSIYTVVKFGKTFADLNGHWSQKDVELIASKLVVKGRTESQFVPDASITRAEFAVLLVRALGLKNDSAPAAKIKDVHGSDWYAGALGAAVRASLMEGFEDGTFRPDAQITREQMAVMISRAMAMAMAGKGGDIETDAIAKFADRSQIHDWALDAVAKNAATGIIQGTLANKFEPAQFATRAEATVMLKRLLVYVGFINK
jgi:hypothetical protein